MKWGNITPTDVDGLMEYQNKCFVLIETKYGNTALPHGQELALKRLIDSLDKPAALFIASHYCDPGTDIEMDKTIVHRTYYKGKWFDHRAIHLRNIVDRFIQRHGGS